MPPPLPLPPRVPPPPRPAPRRWPGYVLLGVVSLALGAILAMVFLKADEARAVIGQSEAAAEVRKLLEAQAAAWNRGDLDGFLAGYWNDPALTFGSEASFTRGWQATLDRYRKKYQADGREMGTLTFAEIEPEPLAAEVVLVRGRWRLEYARSAERPNGVFTLIVKRTADGWRVVHDHTSAEPPPKKV